MATELAPRRLSVTELFYLSIYWFGLNFHWGALLAVAIPAQVLLFVPDADKGRALATVFAGGALVALVVMPLAGALSDRSTSPMGRRRPYVFAGGILNAFALLGLAYAPTFALFIIAYWCVQFANNFGGTAYSGLIPDLVPADQRGQASGFMGLMTMLGTVLAALLAGFLIERNLIVPTYLLIIGVLLITMFLTVWKIKEEPLRFRPPFNIRQFLAGFWVDPRRYPDFAWLFLSRFLAMLGFYTLLNFLQFFLKDYLGIAQFKQATGSVSAAVVVGALLSAYSAGRLSDRIGRRAIVSASTLVMGALCLVFLTGPTFRLMLILSVFFGIAYGAFTSVDWALATDVLPSQASAARDLGIWGISVTLPQVVAPIIGGPLLDIFNRMGRNQGYIALFIVGAGYLIISSLTIWKIKTAK
jgi:MFS family permease